MQEFTDRDFEVLESKLSREIANNDMIMFIGLSALIIVLAVCMVANEIFPKDTLKEFIAATIASLVWLVVRQQLMIHRADGYLDLLRNLLRIEKTQSISPNTIRIRPTSWKEWRTGTTFRLLVLIISSTLSGSLGLLWLFRWMVSYPEAHQFILIVFGILILTGLIMIPITAKYARKDKSITIQEGI